MKKFKNLIHIELHYKKIWKNNDFNESTNSIPMELLQYIYCNTLTDLTPHFNEWRQEGNTAKYGIPTKVLFLVKLKIKCQKFLICKARLTVAFLNIFTKNFATFQ